MRTHMSTDQTDFASARKIWRFVPGNRFLRVVGSAWVVGLLLSMALMYGTALASVAASQENKYDPVSVPSAEKMVPNGEYEIYVFSQDQWQPAGRAAYDRFFREREIDLGNLLPSNSEIRIKILQKGGGAAHIDSVFLGETLPVSVEGIENGVKKLSGKDFDVADAFGKEVVVTFPKGSSEGTLRLTARVESTAISKTPFQFPTDNLYKEMDVNSAFYTYKMNAEKAISPLFKEHSLTGSGHPSGYTYGWARNDDDNLYVKIDFTADNTLDGGKDYAKVYVKTTAGLKEFKVSVPETKWGAADFTYTENVPYQHKVYDFTIPMKELGIADVKQEKELLLAFAAYGTASPQPGPADYSPDSNRYLVVFDSDLNGKIRGRLVDAAGSTVGSEFVISDAAGYKVAPSVAYDSVNHRYLVAWYDNRSSGDNHIYGQLVNTDGTLFGTASNVNFPISTNASYDQWDPEIAFDSANQKYLVVWTDNIGGANDVYGQLVNADGSPDGSNFVISNAAGYQGAPGVAYDIANTRYLVAWSDNRAGANPDIYGQLVNANGTLDGTAAADNFAISTAAESQDAPEVAYDSVNHRYLVIWSDYRSTPKWVAYGQLVNTDGSLYGTAAADNFAISNALYNARFVSLAYDTARQRYLVAWNDDRNSAATGADIYGQYVNASGSLDQGDFSIIQAAGTQSNPATAYNSGCKNFLVTFRNIGVSNLIDQTVVGSCGQLFGTIGYGYGSNPWYGYCPTESTCYDTSYLVELNPETGAIDQYIGEVGYYVNGLAYDPATNRLYGGTSLNDPSPFNGLIEIDTTTGAGTPVGAANWGAGLATPITNITINTAGQIYGWSEESDDLVSIDKATGVATVVGDSGISTGKYGLSFNSADELYLLNREGDFYLIDTGTGLGTSEGILNVSPAHHGDFDPFTDLYYGLNGEDTGNPRTLLRCDLLTELCTNVGSVGAVGNLHTLAFKHQLGTVQYELSINKAGTGTGTVTSSPEGISCGSDCSESYNSGTSVTLTAAADTGSLFAGWSGDCSGSAATTSVTMDSAKTCTATFSPKPINITSPSGEVTWQAGVNQTISWTYTGNPGAYVKIDLLQNGVVRTIVRRVSIGKNEVTWKPQGKLAGSGYKIRVTSTSNSSYTDTSQGTLTISSR